VVIDLHGFSQGPRLEVPRTRFEDLGDAAGFITITPAGRGTPVHWDPRLGSADMAFIGALLDHVEQTLCVDENRVFVAGFSNGAFMASSVACHLAPRVAAVAPVAGLRAVPGCRPARAVPVITFHGTGDSYVPFGGGVSAHVEDLPDPDDPSRTLGDVDPGKVPIAVPGTIGQSIPAALRAWAVRDGCRTTPDTKEVNPDVRRVSFPCPTGVAVELYRIAGGEHHWPGSKDSIAFDAARGHSGRTLDATRIIWDFFSTHPRR
jgi:polyhydroxybutyrate depolymerase